MQMHVLRAERDFGARNAARGDLVERRIQKFRPEVQFAVRRVARRHSRLADLAFSFPALLVALAVPRAGFNCESAIDLVFRGVPLCELAKAADVPLWTRKLPPESFTGPVPKLPDTNDFRRRIMNHLPVTPKVAPRWLEVVGNAVAWADDPFAVWIAQHVTEPQKRHQRGNLRLLSLWAWFSGRPDTLAYRFIQKPWVPSMQPAAALIAAGAWQTTVEFYLEIGEETVADLWTQPGTVDGYEFVPLRSFADVCEEGHTMRNCVQTYGYRLAHNHSRLWSIRKDGKRVATLEIGVARDSLLGVYEIQAAGNKGVPIEVAWAVRQWLQMHHLPSVDTKSRDWDATPLNRALWMAMWKPYWIAKRRFPEWLPLNPSRQALGAF